MNIEETAKAIVDDIVQDFTDRRGLRQEWGQIDEEIQEEILATWHKKVVDRLLAPKEAGGVTTKRVRIYLRDDEAESDFPNVRWELVTGREQESVNNIKSACLVAFAEMFTHSAKISDRVAFEFITVDVRKVRESAPADVEVQVPDLPERFPELVDLDGYVDERGVRFIGKARHVQGSTYHCLADVGGALCLIEVTLSRKPEAT